MHYLNIVYLKWILRLIKPYFLWLAIAVIGLIVLSLINVLNASLLKNMTDTALYQQWNETFKIAILLLPILLIGFLAEFFSKYAIGLFYGGVIKDIKNKVLSHIMKLPIPTLENYHSGELTSRLTNDLNLVQDFLKNTLYRLLANPLIFLSAFIYLFSLNMILAVLSVILTPLMSLIIKRLSAKVAHYSKDIQDNEGTANSILKDVVFGIPIIKSFNLNQYYLNKFQNILKTIVDQKTNINRKNFHIQFMISALVLTPYLCIILLGGYFVQLDLMNISDLVVFIFLMEFMSGPLSQFPLLVSDLRKSAVGFKRIYEILNLSSERLEGETIPLVNNPIIQFKEVDFKYDTHFVLKNVNFQINRGEKVAVVGESGSGKSTIFSLLLSFYTTNTGNIFLGDKDIKDLSPSYLRSQFSVVSQELHLMSDSIKNNIRYGHLDATFEDIVEAAKMADAHDFIMSLPDKYETHVGERGVKLSGGQRQKIAIARAIIKNAPIFLFDEITSSLDNESEFKILTRMNDVLNGRTIIMVSHRLSSIKDAHKILVLSDGNIVESGNHEELIHKKGLYHTLLQEQNIH